MNEPRTKAGRDLVDDDCGTCAKGGIANLAQAMPGFDWDRLVHDAQRHDRYAESWCNVCEEPK